MKTKEGEQSNMSIRYRIRSTRTGNNIRSIKGAWSCYKNRKGYVLQVWEGKGKGWKTVGSSRE